MYTLSQTTKNNIERVIGIPIEQVKAMTAKEEKEWVDKRGKAHLKFSKRRRYGVIGRGNPLIARKKIRTLKDLDKKSRKLFGI